MDLYTNNILELASTIPITTRLKHPDISVTKRTAICGSSITLDLKILESKIREVGIDIKAELPTKPDIRVFNNFNKKVRYISNKLVEDIRKII